MMRRTVMKVLPWLLSVPLLSAWIPAPPTPADESRREGEAVSVEWLAARLRAFVDQHPTHEDAVDRLATFLARDDDE